MGEPRQRLIDARELAGMDRGTAARALSLSAKRISDWEMNRYDIPFKRLKEMAGVYGVSLAALQGSEDLPDRPSWARPDPPDWLVRERSASRRRMRADEFRRQALGRRQPIIRGETRSWK